MPALPPSSEQLWSTELWPRLCLALLVRKWLKSGQAQVGREVRGEMRGWGDVLIVPLGWALMSLLLGPEGDGCVLVILPPWLLHVSFLASWPKSG